MLEEIRALLWKEIKLEWRQKYAFNGIVLYLLTTLFVVYMAAFDVSPKMWVALLWIILLFASVNAVAKSFLGESRWRMLYYYMLARPESMILAKMIYNSLLMLLLSLSGLFFYTIILGNPLQHTGWFLVMVMMGSISFSLCFTMMSAIASKASNGATLMTILSFPVIIPVLLTLLKTSIACLEVSFEFPGKELLMLSGLDLILLILALILFPYLWRD